MLWKHSVLSWHRDKILLDILSIISSCSWRCLDFVNWSNISTSCIDDNIYSPGSLQFKRWFLTVEMFSAWSAAQNSWILLSSWASPDFICAVDVIVTLPDRSFLVATLIYFGRLGQSDGTAWEFNRCFYISSVLFLLSLLPWCLNKVLWAKMYRTDSLS